MKTLPPKLYPFLKHFLAPYKQISILFVILCMVSGLWGVFNSLLIKHIIDTLEQVSSQIVLSSIFWPAVLFVINFQVHNFAERALGYISYKWQAVFKNEIITQTFEYVHQHSHQFFQENLSGRIANRVNMLADNSERIVYDISKHFIRIGALLIVSFLSMYYVHPAFFYGLCMWIFIFATVSMYFSKSVISLTETHASAESIVSGQLVDSITNASNVRAFARKAYEVTYLKKALEFVKKTFQAREIFLIKLKLFQGSSLTVMLIFMLYMLTKLRASNQVTVGDYALILGLSIEVGHMAWWALEQVDELNSALGRCNQSLKSLFLPLGIKDKANCSDLLVDKGNITFEKVKFHYHSANPLFQSLSITIKAGEKVGLVGYSGSGKTTFANLILRLYDVNDGGILIDNQDIRDVSQDSLRSQIAMIPQEPTLFNRTLMENIRYGKLLATDEEVIEAAKKAHAHEFIKKLPEKYESLVGERGVKLSGGQRQRVAIARALLKDAPILILDEATSQLDSITETLIQKSLFTLMENKTALVIAHRLSTLLHMDRILVFDQGGIIQDGTHKQLLAKEGLYKTLWEAQVGGFLPEKRQ